ncbi:MAG TPA: hypothetical protein VEQ10_07960 [Vicinamibacteria bacterium]|nr:hypothetical protein [Vicinamibacteria bacterium]
MRAPIEPPPCRKDTVAATGGFAAGLWEWCSLWESPFTSAPLSVDGSAAAHGIAQTRRRGGFQECNPVHLEVTLTIALWFGAYL